MDARRGVVMAVTARDGGCVAANVWLDVECSGRLDVHEPRRRSQGGDWLNPDECVTLCRAHHDAVHANPERAYEVGLLKRTGD